MKLTQLEKAQKLYERVKELDAQIIELEKTAHLIANGKVEIKLSLKVVDLAKKEQEENKVTFDSDGSLISGDHCSGRHSIFSGLMLSFGNPTPTKREKQDVEQKEIVSENVALQVLGVMLAGKMEQRNLAIKALNKIGVEI